jgi:N-acyl amino acid synthase of PEP-CTERM/exosortase system
MSLLRVCLADTPKLQDAMYRLRYETYTTEVRSFKKEELIGGVETDRYDAYSIHIVACVYDEVVGTLRLVKDNPHGFVMEQAFVIPTYIDRARAVEHSRGIVRKQYRNDGVYIKMLDYAYAWQRNNGYPICLGAPNVERLYKILLDANWKEFGEKKEYHNIVVVPMYYDLSQSV